jgi:hypothetical protein
MTTKRHKITPAGQVGANDNNRVSRGPAKPRSAAVEGAPTMTTPTVTPAPQQKVSDLRNPLCPKCGGDSVSLYVMKRVTNSDSINSVKQVASSLAGFLPCPKCGEYPTLSGALVDCKECGQLANFGSVACPNCGELAGGGDLAAVGRMVGELLRRLEQASKRPDNSPEPPR